MTPRSLATHLFPAYGGKLWLSVTDTQAAVSLMSPAGALGFMTARSELASHLCAAEQDPEMLYVLADAQRVVLETQYCQWLNTAVVSLRQGAQSLSVGVDPARLRQMLRLVRGPLALADYAKPARA